MGGWWRWGLISPDGVAPSRMVNVSASVNLPLHHKVQKFPFGTGSPGLSRKRGRKTVVVVVWCLLSYANGCSNVGVQHGNTALHEAAWNGYSNSVQLLVTCGANVHLMNKVTCCIHSRLMIQCDIFRRAQEPAHSTTWYQNAKKITRKNFYCYQYHHFFILCTGQSVLYGTPR